MMIFLFPVKLNPLCELGGKCPASYTDFIKIKDISNYYNLVSINYLFLLIELISSYLLACFILLIYNKIRR